MHIRHIGMYEITVDLYADSLFIIVKRYRIPEVETIAEALQAVSCRIGLTKPFGVVEVTGLELSLYVKLISSPLPQSLI